MWCPTAHMEPRSRAMTPLPLIFPQESASRQAFGHRPALPTATMAGPGLTTTIAMISIGRKLNARQICRCGRSYARLPVGRGLRGAARDLADQRGPSVARGLVGQSV